MFHSVSFTSCAKYVCILRTKYGELSSDEQIAICGRYNVSTLFRNPQMRSVM